MNLVNLKKKEMKLNKIIGITALSLVLTAGLAKLSFSEENTKLPEIAEIENLAKEGNYQKIIEIYEKIIPNLPETERGLGYYNLASTYDRTGNAIKTINNLERASNFFKKSGDTKNYIRSNLFLSQVYLEEGLISKVSEKLKKIISLKVIDSS